jgi:uncharacterized protein (TIGR02678 family)
VKPLTNQLVIAEREDIARGIRVLLASPILTARAQPADFDLVRRRRDPLVRWFDYYCGWRLVVESRSGYARLAKVRRTVDATRPARRRRSGAAPFDRRRYVLLCVAAAELLGTPVTTIGLLADRVAQATAADPELPTVDTTSRAERMAFVDALRLLESFGAVEVLDGTTESYVDSAAAKVLYRVDAMLVMRLIAAPTSPSRLTSARFDGPAQLAELVREPRYGPAEGPGPAEREDTDDGDGPSPVQRTLALRHAVFRRLLDDPVVHRDDLSDAELGYLISPTGRQLVRRAADEAGMDLEERAEGWLLVDPDGLATDTRFPDDGSHAKVAALALLDRINAEPGGSTPEQLTVDTAALLRRFPRWAKAYQDDDGPRRLRDAAVAVLTQFGLVRRAGPLVVGRPAAARYALADMSARSSATGDDEGVPA